MVLALLVCLKSPLPDLFHKGGNAKRGSGLILPQLPSYFGSSDITDPCSADSGLTEARFALLPFTVYFQIDFGVPGIWIIPSLDIRSQSG